MTRERIQSACKRAGLPAEALSVFVKYLPSVLSADEEIEAEVAAAQAEPPAGGKAK
ncbi:MAG: hypothetical protein KDD67_13815 [Ignavibacteriae bacterium]|nr:hypothetical protein [Ignavibacteriota bacterium]MCB9216136.1 hypothetical protein [Ignavibacteria bacterium]